MLLAMHINIVCHKWFSAACLVFSSCWDLRVSMHGLLHACSCKLCVCPCLAFEFWPDRHVMHAPSSGPNSPVVLLWPGCLMQLWFTLQWTTVFVPCLGIKTVRIFFDRIRDRIRLEGFKYVRIWVRIFNIWYRIHIRILKSHIYDVNIQSYHIRYGWHYLRSNPNPNRNMTTNVISMIYVCIRSVFIPTLLVCRDRDWKRRERVVAGAMQIWKIQCLSNVVSMGLMPVFPWESPY